MKSPEKIPRVKPVNREKLSNSVESPDIFAAAAEVLDEMLPRICIRKYRIPRNIASFSVSFIHVRNTVLRISSFMTG